MPGAPFSCGSVYPRIRGSCGALITTNFLTDIGHQFGTGSSFVARSPQGIPYSFLHARYNINLGLQMTFDFKLNHGKHFQ